MMFMLFNSNMTGITSGAGTVNSTGVVSPPVFSGVRVAQS